MTMGGWRADLRGTRFLIFIGIILILATAAGAQTDGSVGPNPTRRNKTR